MDYEVDVWRKVVLTTALISAVSFSIWICMPLFFEPSAPELLRDRILENLPFLSSLCLLATAPYLFVAWLWRSDVSAFGMGATRAAGWLYSAGLLYIYLSSLAFYFGIIFWVKPFWGLLGLMTIGFQVILLRAAKFILKLEPALKEDRTSYLQGIAIPLIYALGVAAVLARSSYLDKGARAVGDIPLSQLATYAESCLLEVGRMENGTTLFEKHHFDYNSRRCLEDLFRNRLDVATSVQTKPSSSPESYSGFSLEIRRDGTVLTSDESGALNRNGKPVFDPPLDIFKKISDCAESFKHNQAKGAYPRNLEDMIGTGCLSGRRLKSTGNSSRELGFYRVNFYNVYHAGTSEQTFEIHLRPVTYGYGAIHSYYADNSGQIHVTAFNAQARDSDPVVSIDP